MKKSIILSSLLGVAVLSSSASAFYDDYIYKKRIGNGYQFGLEMGYEHSLGYNDAVKSLGINTRLNYPFGRSGFNAGLMLDAKYLSKHIEVAEHYRLDTVATLGTDLLIRGLNLYGGIGAQGFKELEGHYVTGGLDYYYSEDLMINLNYKRIQEQIGNKNRDERVGFSITFPFNHY